MEVYGTTFILGRVGNNGISNNLYYWSDTYLSAATFCLQLALICIIVFVLVLIRISLTHKLADKIVRNEKEKQSDVALISDGSHKSNIIVSLLSGVFIIIISKVRRKYFFIN